mmetsp:Transcript_24582/g.53714  ORF Transcript_24582/g.53714 Transcript_24582/m.53714 type:complete len:80 (-) Transcript_24582:191-430(-)|eukprot:CAMPEP_0202904222 /NCGR_PEP_ID=MMETSP1392-20130828/28369_1 /ASSEMBLY_ACC=CAM_ASM_000868 /TAXON_ID=225041 /ORGANISM="Chlamydomonas chlamydogama, Strain SAG 11-48b" /LENGTH=79 /DNA_ID=CAMNT_0049591751 /DNA_START=195 /DNA_END=434 /DNA_ORIENTATION=-
MVDVAARVMKVIAENVGVDVARVVPSATFTGDLGIDSLQAVELVMTCEKEFHIVVPEAEAAKFVKVQDVIDFFQKMSHK